MADRSRSSSQSAPPDCTEIQDGSRDDRDEEASNVRARSSKKRTKTGCLTCRKRRIKCGEERPICKNCIKSKRHCDGYSQRTSSFGPQSFDYRHTHGHGNTVPYGYHGAEPHLYGGGMQSSAPLGPALPLALATDHLRGRPNMNIDLSNVGYVSSGPRTAPVWHAQQTGDPGFLDPSAWSASNSQARAFYTDHEPHSPWPQIYTQTGFPPSQQYPFDRRSSFSGMRSAAPFQHPVPFNHVPLQHENLTPSAEPTGYFAASEMSSARQHSATTDASTPINARPFAAPISPYDDVTFKQESPVALSVQVVPSREPMGIPLPHVAAHHARHRSGATGGVREHDNQLPATNLPADRDGHSPQIRVFPVPDSMLMDAAIQYHDDNYYDIQPEDESHAAQTSAGTYETDEKTLRQILRIGRLQITGQPGAHSSSDGWALDMYRPEFAANPLRNPATARVFTHFVHATAPVIWGHTRAVPPLAQQTVAPGNQFSQQNLWVDIIPLAALHNQGLLQAILALGSLHIAKLTGASTTPSFKHYAYALKRVHHAVGNRSKRQSIPVLAASLLLGIYELWCAETVKWNSHLAGAAQLLMDYDFSASQNLMLKLKEQRMTDHEQCLRSYQQAELSGQVPLRLKIRLRQYQDLDQVPDIDSRLVSIMTGQVVDYSHRGHVYHDQEALSGLFDELDIKDLETQKDLFWNYCKQDMIGCAISGNPLLMPFSRWTDCPPRAPINYHGLTTGAHDHIMLLLGRIVDFGIRDRGRKLRMMGVNSSKWRPPQPNSPDGAAGSAAPPRPPELPPFFGMTPAVPSGGPPLSYSTHDQASVSDQPDSDHDIDLDSATHTAFQEWKAMEHALEIFIGQLGRDYESLPSTILTPFGPALEYKTPSIACLWTYVHFGWLILHRAHPDMPPHAYVAAAVAAHKTQPHVDRIGQIVGGVIYPGDPRPLTSTRAPTILELCLALFFSGIQVVDAQQREWIVNTLLEIERQCAHEAAGIIARGCQMSWHRAGQSGHGPPYAVNSAAEEEELKLMGEGVRQVMYSSAFADASQRT